MHHLDFEINGDRFLAFMLSQNARNVSISDSNSMKARSMLLFLISCGSEIPISQPNSFSQPPARLQPKTLRRPLQQPNALPRLPQVRRPRRRLGLNDNPHDGSLSYILPPCNPRKSRRHNPLIPLHPPPRPPPLHPLLPILDGSREEGIKERTGVFNYRKCLL